ncbi:MAG: efflux RND transporter permease subunit, partial [Candidatus Binatia bacterium]
MSEAPRPHPLENLGRTLIRARVPVIAFVLVATAFFGWHAAKLQMLSRFDELLPKNHPFIKVHRENAETFGGANSVLVMLEVGDGDIFNLATLDKIFRMTQEIDKIYGVNHYSIESIAHRTNRTLHVGAGGLMEMQPVMETGPKTQADVDRVRRIVHTSQNLYGVLVSLDNKAALLRASFIEGLLDHRKLFQEIEDRIVKPFADEKTTIWVAGEPQLYGWIYRYAQELWWILGATIGLAWVLLYLYFRDWRGALRPTLSGAIAAVWGLGFIRLLGFSLDPLTLVIPFFITARAISHSVQMHERYYEELHTCGGDQQTAIIRSFAALFVPTLSGIVTDALGILAILLVPIEMLQKLAVTASFWIAAITVSELLLNPILYMYLRPPDAELIEARRHGLFQRMIDRLADAVVSPSVRRASFVVWTLVVIGSAFFWTQLVVGDSDAVTPLLRRDSPYNAAHAKIQYNFGGVEPLIVVLQSENPGAMQVPGNVRTIERFQRFLER